MQPTSPTIFDAQNTYSAQRLVAAQARIYSDAKVLLAARITTIAALGLAGAIIAVVFPSARAAVGGAGGAVLLLVSFVAGSLEKRWRTRAACIQEEFDTTVFRLRWNSLQADRANAHDIGRAANRYKGGRQANWYESTKGTHRPFDALACQSSNLGWGATMHFLWAWTLIGFIAVLVAAIIGVEMFLALSWDSFLLALVVPFLAFTKELIEQSVANFETSRSKASAERKVTDLWNRGMSGETTPTDQDLREVQDRIFQFRQSNPHVPDWLDSMRHQRNEAAMRGTVGARIEESRRAGFYDESWMDGTSSDD